MRVKLLLRVAHVVLLLRLDVIPMASSQLVSDNGRFLAIIIANDPHC
jgi:hypothetical protein